MKLYGIILWYNKETYKKTLTQKNRCKIDIEKKTHNKIKKIIIKNSFSTKNSPNKKKMASNLAKSKHFTRWTIAGIIIIHLLESVGHISMHAFYSDRISDDLDIFLCFFGHISSLLSHFSSLSE